MLPNREAESTGPGLGLDALTLWHEAGTQMPRSHSGRDHGRSPLQSRSAEARPWWGEADPPGHRQLEASEGAGK